MNDRTKIAYLLENEISPLDLLEARYVESALSDNFDEVLLEFARSSAMGIASMIGASNITPERVLEEFQGALKHCFMVWGEDAPAKEIAELHAEYNANAAPIETNLAPGLKTYKVRISK